MQLELAGRPKTGSDTRAEYLETRPVTVTRALTGEDLTLDDVWAVAVDGAPAAPLSEEARTRMRAAR